MSGMDRLTGKRIEGMEHIVQSIRDILTTPLGTRVMRRDYGSELFALIDQPMNTAMSLRIAASVAGAVHRWEPRVRLTLVRFHSASALGGAAIDIEGRRLDLPLFPAFALKVPL
ncbi:GPW/gp25 family protein [Asticcacaulis machinosus]|uniref:GPW/gp25 family protein n=1 Tax=Asticcacaulis machinosus TaxID=2984211 RepID=A0ABT5HH15_9CAUL|nr:GPW/gp25 family protein [Asticcacaulis machinosus]MDC7675386.1 GPW/gp25 family protein [Asticcacaulis machinosus]